MLIVCADHNVYLRPTAYVAGTDWLGVNTLEAACNRPSLDWTLAVAMHYMRNIEHCVILQGRYEGIYIDWDKTRDLEDAAIWLYEHDLCREVTKVAADVELRGSYRCAEEAVLESIADFIRILEA